MNKLFLLPLILLSIKVSSQIKVPDSILNHIESIDSNRIKAHVAFLADDKLKGRKPGTPGFQMAVDYVVEQFKILGLKSAGENNTYLQKVILRNAKLLKDNSNINITLANGQTKNLSIGEDINLYPHPESKEINFKAPLVFVGAGFDDPKLGLNDYKNIDVKGKIVVILRKIPNGQPENIKRHLTYTSTYQEFAAKNGAIGVLFCNYALNNAQFKSAGATLLTNGVNASVNSKGKRASSSQILGGKIRFFGSISVVALREIMASENENLDNIWNQMDSGAYVNKPMKSTVKGHYESSFTDVISYNTIAKLEGADPKLKHEYVIHSGHLDHLGIAKPINGDSINNGAHDNASGIACSLEIARMYASLKEKPRRSILFVFVTAEEMGLLGSGYFAKYPTIPINKIVADINTDMPTIIAPLESVTPLGAEHSSLQATVEQAAELLNLKVENDPDPSEGRFVRSDQYNFLKAGIPALHIKYGYKYSSPKYNLAEKVKVWREANYHKPSDELNDSFVWSAGRKFSQLNFLVSYIVAQSDKRPIWLAGDFFNPL